MAEGVENALKDVLKHIGMMDTETAEKTLEEMRRNSRYQEDIFGWSLLWTILQFISKSFKYPAPDLIVYNIFWLFIQSQNTKYLTI